MPWRGVVRPERPLPHNARIVLEALRRADQPVKAYGLLEQLQEEGISAPMTVYRALDRLIADGLVRKIGALNAFIALPAPLHQPVAVIICRQCSKTRTEHLDVTVCTWLHRLGIEATAAHLEAFSDCAGCAADGVPSGDSAAKTTGS
jgi:Fur family zinc uptake transcriptional regulator